MKSLQQIRRSKYYYLLVATIVWSMLISGCDYFNNYHHVTHGGGGTITDDWSGQIELITCSLTSPQDFYSVVDYSGSSWDENYFFIGDKDTEIGSASTTASTFSLSGSQYNKTYQASGSIRDGILISVSITEEYTGAFTGTYEGTSTKILSLSNLEIDLRDLTSGVYTEVEVNDPTGMVSSIADDYYYRDFADGGTMKMYQQISNFDDATFASSGKIIVGLTVTQE